LCFVTALYHFNPCDCSKYLDLFETAYLILFA